MGNNLTREMFEYLKAHQLQVPELKSEMYDGYFPHKYPDNDGS